MYCNIWSIRFCTAQKWIAFFLIYNVTIGICTNNLWNDIFVNTETNFLNGKMNWNEFYNNIYWNNGILNRVVSSTNCDALIRKTNTSDAWKISTRCYRKVLHLHNIKIVLFARWILYLPAHSRRDETDMQTDNSLATLSCWHAKRNMLYLKCFLLPPWCIYYFILVTSRVNFDLPFAYCILWCWKEWDKRWMTEIGMYCTAHMHSCIYVHTFRLYLSLGVVPTFSLRATTHTHTEWTF